MAIGYNQIICNARNLATTMNGIINALAEGVTIIGRPKILQLENNDDLLISWYEGTGGGGGGGGGGGDEPSGGDEVLKALIERSITEITIPDGVTQIGASAFSSCTALESAFVPEGVTLIGGSAFSGCTELTTVDLPSTLTRIEESVFYNDKKLTSITVRATTPPILNGSYIFNYVPAAANIYVPAASVSAYKTANNWKNRADYIQAIPS